MDRIKSNKNIFYKFIFYLILFFHPLVFINFYLTGNWYSFFHDYTLGMVFGITGYCWLCASLLLSTRFSQLDRIIGQDRVLEIHGILAASAIICGFIHLILKLSYLSSFSLQTSSGAFSFAVFFIIMFMTFLFMVEKPPFPFPGFTAVKTKLLKYFNIDYSIMKNIHNFFAAALFFLIIHVLASYSTAENLIRIYAMGLYGAAALLRYLYFLFFKKPFGRNMLYSVFGVENLAPYVVRIRMSPVSPIKKLFIYHSGQFAYFRFKSDSAGPEEHPFTLSSSPSETEISLTVKRAGDYTSKLASLKPGDRVSVDGPYGLFSPVADGRQKLFIAGGIGITPFLSVLKDWEIRGLSFSACLLWSIRFESELIDIPMLERIKSGNPDFSYRIFVTGEDSSVYSRGRIGESDLERALYSGALKNTDVYVCGPLQFMSSVRKMAVKAGVPKRNIHFENFSA